MESTEQGQGDDVALVGWFNGARCRSILVDRPVGTVLMIIAEVIREPLTQMVLVEHDHVVQAFPADGTDQALDAGILPGRTRCNEFLFHAQVLNSAHKFQTVNGIAIAEEITGRLGVGKRFVQLLRGPGCRRRISNIEMKHFAALVREDQKDIEDTEGGGRDDEEIHGDEVFGGVVEEGFPGLVAATGSGSILANGGIRNCNPEFSQFSLNTFAPPGGIAGPHSANEFDEFDEFAIHGGSVVASPGFPASEQAKAQPMPGDDRLRLKEEQALLPVWPEPSESQPE